MSKTEPLSEQQPMRASDSFQMNSLETTGLDTDSHIPLRKGCGTKGSDVEIRQDGACEPAKVPQIVDGGSDNACGNLLHHVRSPAPLNLKNVRIPPDSHDMDVLCSNSGV